jgi:serine/threonine protein kinase
VEPAEIIGGRYRLDRKIGQGGTGSIWLAQDARLERQVAIKFLFARTPEQQDRFARRVALEAKIAASIQHHSVVQIFDFGVHEAQVPYIVMEALSGFTLGAAFDEHHLFSVDVLTRMMCSVLEGLSVVHQAGIVHRDLKPENIFLVKERGERLSPKLLDFGISRSLEPDTRRSAVTTIEGMIVGTPQYMSPEQARGLGDIDKRTDIYSIGVIMFEAFSGVVPFDSPNLGDLLVQVIRGGAPSLRTVVPQLGAALCDVVDKALASERSQRYSDAAEMHEALLAAVVQIPAELDRLTPMFPPPGPRSRARTSREGSSKEFDLSGQGEPTTQPSAALGTDATVHITKGARRSSKPPRSSTLLSFVDAPPPAARRSKRWILIGIGGAALLLVTVLGTIALMEREPNGEGGFIVVQAATPESLIHGAHDAARAAAGALPTPASATQEESAAEPRTRRAPSPKSRKPKPETEDPLQLLAADVATAFSRQKSKVINCLDQFPDEMQDAPQITLRVTVDGGGTASNVQLLPESLSTKRVGSCVTQAVLGMTFPPQAQPATFRIPLYWRRR